MAAAAPTTHCALAVTMGIPPVEALVDDEPVAEALDADAPEAPDDELAVPVDFEPEDVGVEVALAVLGALPMAPAVMVTGTAVKISAMSLKEVLSAVEKDETPLSPTCVALQTPEELPVITHPRTIDLEAY
jgi:hypothetical protein